MWYVYFLKSSRIGNWIYVGSTDSVKRRLTQHNDGLVFSTKPYRPVYLDAYVAVRTEKKARELEKYFKVGSGKAIAKKRLLSSKPMSVPTDEALA